LENEKIGERLASIETELKNQGNKLTSLEKDKELLYRLTIVSEQQQEMNKHQQIQLNKMDKTFNNINLNLTKLNLSQDELQNNVKNIRNRVDGIEEDLKTETSKGTISFNEILYKYLIWWILLPTVVISAWILFKLGL